MSSLSPSFPLIVGIYKKGVLFSLSFPLMVGIYKKNILSLPLPLPSFPLMVTPWGIYQTNVR
jgi:hypothetical protein